MTYEYTGKIVEILKVEDIRGQSKIFTRKQTIICKDNSNNKCAFLLFDDKITLIEEIGIKVGDTVIIDFSIKARIYRGEWYSNAYCLSIKKKERQQRQQNQYQEHKFYWDFGNVKNNTWFQDCSTKEERKKRYRELSKKHHPDMPGGDSKIMQEINNAYDRYK